MRRIHLVVRRQGHHLARLHLIVQCAFQIKSVRVMATPYRPESYASQEFTTKAVCSLHEHS